MNIRRLGKKEIKEINYELGTGFSKKDVVEIKEAAGFEILAINGKFEFFMYKGRWVATLKRVYEKGAGMKSVTVDKGAISFVSNGADIMRPGVVKIDKGINKGDPVLIKEEVHGKILAIGEMLYEGEEVENMRGGKVVKNLHYVGDKLWNSS